MTSAATALCRILSCPGRTQEMYVGRDLMPMWTETLLLWMISKYTCVKLMTKFQLISWKKKNTNKSGHFVKCWAFKWSYSRSKLYLFHVADTNRHFWQLCFWERTTISGLALMTSMWKAASFGQIIVLVNTPTGMSMSQRATAGTRIASTWRPVERQEDGKLRSVTRKKGSSVRQVCNRLKTWSILNKKLNGRLLTENVKTKVCISFDPMVLSFNYFSPKMKFSSKD